MQIFVFFAIFQRRNFLWCDFWQSNIAVKAFNFTQITTSHKPNTLYITLRKRLEQPYKCIE